MHFPKTGKMPSLATENRHLSVKLVDQIDPIIVRSIQLNTPLTCYTTGQVKNRILIYHTVVRQSIRLDD